MGFSQHRRSTYSWGWISGSTCRIEAEQDQHISFNIFCMVKSTIAGSVLIQQITATTANLSLIASSYRIHYQVSRAVDSQFPCMTAEVIWNTGCQGLSTGAGYRNKTGAFHSGHSATSAVWGGWQDQQTSTPGTVGGTAAAAGSHRTLAAWGAFGLQQCAR